MNKKGVLIILDGYGEGEPNAYNAVRNAKTPFLDFVKSSCPTTTIRTDGEYVGLEAGDMGGSEVGHQTIGAGRVVQSKVVRINDAIRSGKFANIDVVKDALSNAQDRHIHIIGLLSDKNIHSNISHLYGVLDACKKYKTHKVFVHVITDGRDTEIDKAVDYVTDLQSHLDALGFGEIASLGGRFFAMDREGNLDRTQQGFDAMFSAENTVDDPIQYLRDNYAKGVYDEYIPPVHMFTLDKHQPSADDIFIFYNTREDRMRQLAKMAQDTFTGATILSMTKYGEYEHITPIFSDQIVQNTLSEYLSRLGLRQLKISETTKYAHVTYFMNGQREEPWQGEDRVHIPTIKTADFAQYPAMRAREITAETVKAIKSGTYDLIILNFSNPDMIGHTANYPATVKSLEILDKCVKKIVDVAFKKGFFTVITADHGNSEELRTPDGKPQTAHTLNPVMFSILDKDNYNLVMRNNGSLRDVAPTLLALMDVPKNEDFTGTPLYYK